MWYLCFVVTYEFIRSSGQEELPKFRAMACSSYLCD